MEISLICHTAVQAPGICYDVPLADTFAAAATQLRSNCPRCRTEYSAALRCQALATEITPSECLRETNFGAWENRLWAELPRAETAPKLAFTHGGATQALWCATAWKGRCAMHFGGDRDNRHSVRARAPATGSA